jgi:cytochrome c oxidase subunit 1
MILPAMGVISELVTCFARRRVYGYGFIAASSLLIAILGFLVWGHHMFVSGQSGYAATCSRSSRSSSRSRRRSRSSTGRRRSTAARSRGSRRCSTRSASSASSRSAASRACSSATLGFDVHVHDTYFIVAHFHYIMVGGTIMAYLGGIHFWWPKITGRMYPEALAKISGFIVFIGFNLTFFPQFILGYLGMPRRYHAYPDEFQVLNVLSSAGASILASGTCCRSATWRGRCATARARRRTPWQAAGLEWTTPVAATDRELHDSARRDDRRVRVRPRRRDHERGHPPATEPAVA